MGAGRTSDSLHICEKSCLTAHARAPNHIASDRDDVSRGGARGVIGAFRLSLAGLRSRNCALPDYCHARIFGGREAARARIKVANGQLVADLCRARFDVLQAVVTHWALLCRPQPT